MIVFQVTSSCNPRQVTVPSLAFQVVGPIKQIIFIPLAVLKPMRMRRECKKLSRY